MAGNRYNTFHAYSYHTDFFPWLFISLLIHTALAITVTLSKKAEEKIFYIPVYEVDLLHMPEVVKPAEVPPVVKAVPPQHKDVKPKPNDVKPKKAGKGIAVRKPKETAGRPDKAIERLREKVAAEEAIERIRKKVREKEEAPRREVRIAAGPPARVYRYEELDAELRAYFDKISRMIRRAWSLPETLQNKGYKTVLSIHVRRDGTVESVWIEEGSGNSFYDDTALRAINKVNPLPPLPKGWKGKDIDLGLRF